MSITADQEKSVLTNVNSQLFIGGEWREATGGETLDVEDPSTGESIASVADATPEDAAARSTPPAPSRTSGPRILRASAARSCAAPTRRSPRRPTSSRS